MMFDLRYAFGENKHCNLDLDYFPDSPDDNPRAKWHGNPIRYVTNEWGYRSDKFEENPDSVIFLGCSHTMGIGLPLEDVWCSIVAKELGRKGYNLGVNGGSMDTAFRVLSQWLPLIKSKLVCVQEPTCRREVIHAKQGIARFLPNFTWAHVQELLLGEEEYSVNRDKNVRAIQNLCDQYGAKLIMCDPDWFCVHLNGELARDKMHWGIPQHQEFAKNTLDAIINNRYGIFEKGSR
tara:strand:+ start:10489 stop:11193 length:705 start_codon:yes stop_codon:yes gene_type:complete